MPFRLAPAAALLLLALSGCSLVAPTPTPTTTPEPTVPPGEQTLRTLIEAAPESPTLSLGAETPGDGFHTVEASYLSEGLTITGVVYLPEQPGVFPGVVVVHGSVDPATFTTGSDLVREQQDLARTGHVVFAPDLRGLGGSDPDPVGEVNLVGQTLDVANAGRALAASGIPSLNSDRIGLFGHSLGGGNSLGAMVIAPDVFDVVATMSPVSSRAWWVIDHYYPRDSPGFLALANAHGTYEENPLYWDDVAAATFAARSAAPLLVVVGTDDDPVFAVWAEHTVADWNAAGAEVTLITVEGGNHRLDPHWGATFAQIRSFVDQTLLP